MSIRDELEKLKETLIQQRDELRLKAGLAKLEVRDEWEQIEGRVDHFMGRMEALGSETAHASEDVLESARKMGEEIRAAYERIRQQL